jgi:hypothetical protein
MANCLALRLPHAGRMAIAPMRLYAILIAAVIVCAGSARPQRSVPGAGEAEPPCTAIGYLRQHPVVAARLTPLLPRGLAARQAADGFKSWDQFVTALEVSKSLSLSFADLKRWITGPEPLPLAKAIQALQPSLPDAQVRASIQAAGREARQLERPLVAAQ